MSDRGEGNKKRPLKPSRREFLSTGGIAAILAAGGNLGPLARMAEGAAIPQDTPPPTAEEKLRDVALVTAAITTPIPGGEGSIEAELQAKEQSLAALGKYLALYKSTPEEDRPALLDGIVRDTREGGVIVDKTFINGVNKAYTDYDPMGDSFQDLTGKIGAAGGAVLSFLSLSAPAKVSTLTGSIGSTGTSAVQSNQRAGTKGLILDAVYPDLVRAVDRTIREIEDLETRQRMQQSLKEVTGIDFLADNVSLMPESAQEGFKIANDLLKKEGEITEEGMERYENAVMKSLKKEQDTIKENEARPKEGDSTSTSAETPKYDPNVSARAHSNIAGTAYFATFFANEFGSEDFGRAVGAISNAVVVGDTLIRAYGDGKGSLGGVGLAAGTFQLAMGLAEAFGKSGPSVEEQLFDALEHLSDQIEQVNKKLYGVLRNQTIIMNILQDGFAEIVATQRRQHQTLMNKLDNLADRLDAAFNYEIITDRSEEIAELRGAMEALDEMQNNRDSKNPDDRKLFSRTAAQDERRKIFELAVTGAHKPAFTRTGLPLDDSESAESFLSNEDINEVLRTTERVDYAVGVLPDIALAAKEILREAKEPVNEPESIDDIANPRILARATAEYVASGERFPRALVEETMQERTTKLREEMDAVTMKLGNALDRDTALDNLERAYMVVMNKIADRIQEASNSFMQQENPGATTPETPGSAFADGILPFQSHFERFRAVSAFNTEKGEIRKEPGRDFFAPDPENILNRKLIDGGKTFHMFADITQNVFNAAEKLGLITTITEDTVSEATFTDTHGRRHPDGPPHHGAPFIGTFKKVRRNITFMGGSPEVRADRTFPHWHRIEHKINHITADTWEEVDIEFSAGNGHFGGTRIDNTDAFIRLLKKEVHAHHAKLHANLRKAIKDALANDTELMTEFETMGRALKYMAGLDAWTQTGDLERATQIAKGKCSRFLPATKEELLGKERDSQLGGFLGDLLSEDKAPFKPIMTDSNLRGNFVGLAEYLSEMLRHTLGKPKASFIGEDVKISKKRMQQQIEKEKAFPEAKKIVDQDMDIIRFERNSTRAPEVGTRIAGFMVDAFPEQSAEGRIIDIELAQAMVAGFLAKKELLLAKKELLLEQDKQGRER